jgi:hypothetical protein
MVTVPLLTPGQEVIVEEKVELMPVPEPTVTDLVPVQLLASRMVMVCVPEVNGFST